MRKSPGVALAGAAIVGFALARLVKSGFDDARGRNPGRRRLMLKPNTEPMQEPEDEQPIGEVISQLVDEGKAYAKAEVELAKASALAKAAEFKVSAILLFAALLFAQAAVTVLAVTIALALAPADRAAWRRAGRRSWSSVGQRPCSAAGDAAAQGLPMTDAKVEAARIEVERSRAQLLDTAKVLQQRLQPGKLTRDAWESAKKGRRLAEDAVDAVRARPYAAGGVVAAIALFIAREPVKELFGKLTDAMTF